MDTLTFIAKTPHTTVNSQTQTPDIMLGHGNDIQAAEDNVIYQQVPNVSHIEVVYINQVCRNWQFFFFEST